MSLIDTARMHAELLAEIESKKQELAQLKEAIIQEGMASQLRLNDVRKEVGSQLQGVEVEGLDQSLPQIEFSLSQDDVFNLLKQIFKL